MPALRGVNCMSRVCAIIPTFNREKLLVECLDSLLRQTRPVDEIIVVNDGSTDNTATVLQSFGHQIRVLSQGNSGKAAALNAALGICESDLIWICDDDDIASPDGLAQLTEAIEADPDLDFVHGRFLRFFDTAEGRNFLPPWPVARPEEDSALINFLESACTFQFAQLVRRTAYDRVGRFREDLLRSQDYDMAIRLVRTCKSTHVPKIIFYQRQHDGTRGTSADPIDQEKILEKWIYYDQVIFRNLRDSLTLAEVTPKFARKLEGRLSRRAALLQRSCIFAAKGLWESALDDLETACIETTSVPLPEEINLASSAVRDSLVWNSLVSDFTCWKRLKQCRTSGSYGQQIVAALIRPLIHLTRRRLTERAFGPAVVQTQLLAGVLGFRSFALSVGRAVIT
jgi:glycosyltransferase involved in cell wall biosynthesis